MDGPGLNRCESARGARVRLRRNCCGIGSLAERGCGGACRGTRRACGRRRIASGEVGVQLRDNRGSLPDRRTHSLYRAATHVADGEDPFDPRLQRQRGSLS